MQAELLSEYNAQIQYKAAVKRFIFTHPLRRLELYYFQVILMQDLKAKSYHIISVIDA